ncbi:MAG TPA: hypothetical protein VG387_13865 [Rhizomicrobium sp.]|jgi:hypothetical protein|nr:hypothetical protein [Rhizomicrobium sp.]
MARRHRIPVQLTPYTSAPPRIGHNGGPVLDLSWEAWLWRKALAEAHKPPRRDIALHRLRRAERLGLDYRSYAGVLMNRGTHLGGAIFVLNGLAEDERRAADTRIAALSDCAVLAGAPSEPRALSRAIDRFLLAHKLTPGGIFLVGTAPAHLHAAEDAGLALFLWAKDYFSRVPN